MNAYQKGQTIEITITNFFVDPQNIIEDRLVLTAEEAKHLHQVLRAKAGDTFYAIDGSGLKYRTVIETISDSSVKGFITTVTRLDNEPFYHITLAQGICRPTKMDEIVERGTEIGVSSFIFYFSEKGYSKMQEESSSAKRVSRLNRIAKAAAKLSKRSLIPSIGELFTFREILGLRSQFDLSMVAVFDSSAKSVESYLDNKSSIKKILLMVGPESGFSKDEETACLKSGFLPVSLGPRRLRTETAGIIFPALVLSHLGDI